MQLKHKNMKKILYIIPILILAFSCKAQSPIINIEDQTGDDIEGAYYKDTNNLLDPFVGTYIYTNGNTSLKIVLQKKTMSSMNNYYFEDLLIGEYQYVENGVEKVNTLNQLSINYADQSKHSINGNGILTGTQRGCDTCGPNEIRVTGGLTESSTNNFALIYIRLITVNNQPAIDFNVYWQSRSYNVDTQPVPASPSFPGGGHILLKQ
jgi:hypothetical protein